MNPSFNNTDYISHDERLNSVKIPTRLINLVHPLSSRTTTLGNQRQKRKSLPTSYMPTALDVYKPERWVDDALFRTEVRTAYAKLVKQGWADALRALHPDERIYTFWDYFRRHWQTNSGLRIDHVLLDAKLKPRLLDAGVDTWVRGLPGASDHAPAWVELDV